MGSTHPYYRRSKPQPQSEKDFARDISLKQAVQQLRGQGTLPQGETITFKDLNQRLQPVIPGSMRSLLLKMFAIAYPVHINLVNAHMESYGISNPVAEANRLFDNRAAAAVYAAVSPQRGVKVYPNVKWKSIEFDLGIQRIRRDWPFHVDDNTGDVSNSPGEGLFSDIDLLEMKFYGDAAPTIYIPLSKCLAAIAYLDYFPDSLHNYLSGMVSQAILAANCGWCGTFGPNVDSFFDVIGSPSEGNYDMSQMRLLPIAYRYYDELSPAAQEHLVTVLLERGRIHRPNLDDIFTSGGAPNDWSRAGFVNLGGPGAVIVGGGQEIRIGETENHILMIHTARYLTNQLLYQRDHHPDHDNCRNGGDDRPSCTDLMLYLLRNILRGDFSEYNAKPYQAETRSALLNLCSYAYDHEVRLAARMVLDYISAHIAVSSNDLRRMVPFRRRNEGKEVAQLSDGFMAVGLLEWFQGADPMTEPFAMQTGNSRAYEKTSQNRLFPWSIASDGGASVMDVLSDYRLPPLIHDLFVNDSHRRFFQRLHRKPQDNQEVTGRNCDNMEIYAGSPSYLITAGGAPATYAINPGPSILLPKGQRASAQQLGVAVTTSFMPTAEYIVGAVENASNLIQFSSFSARPGEVENYGVASDFACGYKVYLPSWVPKPRDREFLFIDRKYYGKNDVPGFYLAIFIDGDFGLLEAYDCWLQRNATLTFEQFKAGVLRRNASLRLLNGIESQYTTHNGKRRLHFLIWDHNPRPLIQAADPTYGAKIVRIDYADGASQDDLIDAGHNTDSFLSGTVMNSPEEGVVEINNPFLGTKITLDMSDQKHPKRISETGEVEESGFNNEVWVDFDWAGSSEGDFFRPFKTIAAATAAVADGGVIKIMPGSTSERPVFAKGKRIRFTAPIGGVTIGSR